MRIPEELERAARAVLRELQGVMDDRSTPPPMAEVARSRLASLSGRVEFLRGRAFRVAFVGPVGVGKTAIVGSIPRLFDGDVPTTDQELNQRSILPVGGGRTTICEVRVRCTTPAESSRVGLLIDPLPPEQMAVELAQYAALLWAEHNAAAAGRHDRGKYLPREVERALDHMTGLSKRFGHDVEARTRWIASCGDEESLTKSVIDAADLSSRTEQAWWWGNDAAGLHALHVRLHEVNSGRYAKAALPRIMTIAVPDTCPGSQLGLQLELVDTRGLDGHVASRDDIRERLQDRTCIVVACSTFVDAPHASVAGLLEAMAADATIRPALERSSLIIVDKNEARLVNDAEGDSATGRRLKQGECERQERGHLEERAGLDLRDDAELHLLRRRRHGFGGGEELVKLHGCLLGRAP